MASIAWTIFGTILIINSAASIIQYSGRGKCYCGSIETICRSHVQYFDYFLRPFSSGYCTENEVVYCDISDGTISETCGMKKMMVMHENTADLAQVGEYAWQAAIFTTNDEGSGYKYIGAGVLINKKHVLTVVPLVESICIDDLIIRLGEFDLSSDGDICCQQDYRPIKIIKHPGFNTDTMENNIALIILDKIVPLATSPHINTACLSSSPPSFESCWIAGWGSSQRRTRTSRKLRTVNMPIVNRFTCQLAFDIILEGSYRLPESIMCAGDGIMNSCMIDGGAPLICESTPGKMVVVGLVSAPTGCIQDVPNLFTNVSQFTSWIHQQVFEYY